MTLESGRDAYRRHAWSEAVEALTAADREKALAPEDLEVLGTASWWAGRPDESIEALERAFAGFSEHGRAEDAARIALQLSYQALRGLADSVGAGWLARAERLLEPLPESPTHAWAAVFRVVAALQASRIADASELADRANEMARRQENTDALFMAMSFKGYAEVVAGNWQAGLGLIDEAAAAAASGQLDLRVASDIWCNTIAACRSAGDLKRAAQWVTEGERWMRREGVGGYPGVCRVHRAELLMLRGEWPVAEQEARRACDELQRYGLLDAIGSAHYQVGEIRLRMGDLDAASAAFERAYEFGNPAQPGLALLQLARGEVAEANRSIARAVAMTADAGEPQDRAQRAWLLPAQVDIAIAADDFDTARRAVEDLEGIAADFERPFFQASAMTARGGLLLGESRPSDASPVLGQSWRIWQTTDLPYESAQARLRYAQALAAEGDEAAARRDLLAARAAFERLGATRDVQRVDAILGPRSAPAARTAERATKTFMFTDIVTSTDLVGLIGDEAWSELLSWHNRELRSAIGEHNGIEVNQTGDGFFVAFDLPADAIACAIDIQRRLVTHRREHGFAPWVRIGIHATEATREGRDFSGRGVHLAARVGAAAERDEILVTASTLDAPGSTRFRLAKPRALSLKGISEPVEVSSVDWR